MCRLCRSGAAVKALLKEDQSDVLCLSLPRQELSQARMLWQVRKTVSIINFQSLGVKAPSAVSGVILGQQHGLTWAGLAPLHWDTTMSIIWVLTRVALAKGGGCIFSWPIQDIFK